MIYDSISAKKYLKFNKNYETVTSLAVEVVSRFTRQEVYVIVGIENSGKFAIVGTQVRSSGALSSVVS